MIQINFGSAFLTRRPTSSRIGRLWPPSARMPRSTASTGRDPGLEEFGERTSGKSNPRTTPTVSDVVAHIDHVVELVGIDHVGLGSDFDGVGDSLPTGLKDVSQYPNLIAALLEAGYSDEDVEKISAAT